MISVGFLFILQQIQFNVKGLLTGIGSLGLTSASQDTIKSCFGSLVILMDRPFCIGGYIVYGLKQYKRFSTTIVMAYNTLNA